MKLTIIKMSMRMFNGLLSGTSFPDLPGVISRNLLLMVPNLYATTRLGFRHLVEALRVLSSCQCCHLIDWSVCCRLDTHSQHTFVQYSLFTSAERIARAWLKSHGLQCHLCGPAKNVSSDLIHVSSLLVVASPAVYHEHIIFLILPLHKNTQHDRFNMITSTNTQYITHISMLSQPRSSAIKNHSGVKTCRVAETRAQHSPQVMSPIQTLQNNL